MYLGKVSSVQFFYYFIDITGLLPIDKPVGRRGNGSGTALKTLMEYHSNCPGELQLPSWVVVCALLKLLRQLRLTVNVKGAYLIDGGLWWGRE